MLALKFPIILPVRGFTEEEKNIKQQVVKANYLAMVSLTSIPLGESFPAAFSFSFFLPQVGWEVRTGGHERKLRYNV